MSHTTSKLARSSPQALAITWSVALLAITHGMSATGILRASGSLRTPKRAKDVWQERSRTPSPNERSPPGRFVHFVHNRGENNLSLCNLTIDFSFIICYNKYVKRGRGNRQSPLARLPFNKGTDKTFWKIFQKPLDKLPKICYNKYTKREPNS